MITPLSVEALSLADRGYRVYVHEGELMITRDIFDHNDDDDNNGDNDVHINCIYTKDEINKLINDVSNGCQMILLTN